MDEVEMRSILWRYNSSVRGRLNSYRVPGLEDYYRLAERMHEMANFVLMHFDDMALEDASVVVQLLVDLDGVHVMNGPVPNREVNSANAEKLLPLIQDCEKTLTEKYNYRGFISQKGVEKEKIDELIASIDSLKSDLEDCSLQYVMNSVALRELGVEKRIGELYENAVNYLQNSIREIESSIEKTEILVGCAEVIKLDTRLAELLVALMQTRSPEKLEERMEAFEKVLGRLIQRKEEAKQQTVAK